MSEVVARLRQVATGEIRDCVDTSCPGHDLPGIIYQWTGGNYGCDCNRAIFFDDPDESCGRTRYALERLTLDGQELDIAWEEDHRP